MTINPSGAASSAEILQIDEAYEFCAPRFFDFMNEETEEEIQRAEHWFETSLSYAPSPFMPRIKVGRSVQIDSLCDLGNGEQTLKEPEPAEVKRDDPKYAGEKAGHVITMEVNAGHQVEDVKVPFESVPEIRPCDDDSRSFVGISTSTDPKAVLSKDASSFTFPVLPSADAGLLSDKMIQAAEACTPESSMVAVKGSVPANLKNQTASDTCTPKAQRGVGTTGGGGAPSSSKKQTSKKAASLMRPSSALKPKTQLGSVQSAKPKSICSSTATKTVAADIAQENQAIKRQKLDGGRARQILNVKSRVFPHKSKPGLTRSSSDLSAVKDHHQGVAPFMSTAEMVRKFQSGTREIELSHNRSLLHDEASVIRRRPKLTLTRPKEPELETTHRARAVRVKSSAELEEEMLAKIPKFKARGINKKILEAPTLLALPRSAPQPPEFQEFHLKTMERAIQHAETSSMISSSSAKDLLSQDQGKPPLKLTEPRPPQLETALRARPQKMKSSQELEQEELEKVPKFKARPLNKKILESRGDLGLYCNPKPQVTTPQEFHFPTNERMGPPATVMEHLFDKLSLQSEPHHDVREVPRITIPNPFRLHTEERGIEKERQFVEQILRKQLEEERARIPKAKPYPYTTDYPVIPPKPEPKQCTKPEAFQLESLVKHEEEMQRKFEERQRIEKEEAQRRMFKAQPVIRDDPLPLPERQRKPLTDVQEFVLHVDDRAVHRSEFDKKIKEKEVVYKRLREEYETVKAIEEEKAVKQMRRTMIPHARPLPKFDTPFLPHKSVKETTKPKSPSLQVRQREERRHHMR